MYESNNYFCLSQKPQLIITRTTLVLSLLSKANLATIQISALIVELQQQSQQWTHKSPAFRFFTLINNNQKTYRVWPPFMRDSRKYKWFIHNIDTSVLSQELEFGDSHTHRPRVIILNVCILYLCICIQVWWWGGGLLSTDCVYSSDYENFNKSTNLRYILCDVY